MADVLIAGAGPAGATLAIMLGRAGLSVEVYDAHRFPREKPCAGAISAWGLEALAAIGVELDVPHAPMRG